MVASPGVMSGNPAPGGDPMAGGDVSQVGPGVLGAEAGPLPDHHHHHHPLLDDPHRCLSPTDLLMVDEEDEDAAWKEFFREGRLGVGRVGICVGKRLSV